MILEKTKKYVGTNLVFFITLTIFTPVCWGMDESENDEYSSSSSSSSSMYVSPGKSEIFCIDENAQNALASQGLPRLIIDNTHQPDSSSSINVRLGSKEKEEEEEELSTTISGKKDQIVGTMIRIKHEEVKSNPQNAILQILCHYSHEKNKFCTVGTGFVINQCVVMTAAHVLCHDGLQATHVS